MKNTQVEEFLDDLPETLTSYVLSCSENDDSPTKRRRALALRILAKGYYIDHLRRILSELTGKTSAESDAVRTFVEHLIEDPDRWSQVAPKDL